MKLTKIAFILTSICLIQQQNMYAEKWTEIVISRMKNSEKITQDYQEIPINKESEAIDLLNSCEKTFLFTILTLGLSHAINGEKLALLCLGVATIATMVEIYIIKVQIEQLQNTSKANEIS